MGDSCEGEAQLRLIGELRGRCIWSSIPNYAYQGLDQLDGIWGHAPYGS